jgi:phage tail-like protein
MSCITPEEFNYLVINTPGRWREGVSDSVSIDRDGHLSLAPVLSLDLFGEIGQATGLAIDHRGDLYIIDADNCQIYKFAPESQSLRRLECSAGRCIDEGKSFAFQPGQTIGLFGCGSEEGKFKFKSMDMTSGGLAFGMETLYVADPFNHRVQAFYLPQFQIRMVLGKRGNPGEGRFDHPKDIVTDSKGNLYVLDYGNQCIQKFNRFGAFSRSFGTALGQPESLAIDRDDLIYVVDSAKATVERFNPKGELVDTPVRFHKLCRQTQPSAVAVDENKIIYVGERGTGGDLSIHQFDQTGNYQGHFGEYSDSCFKLVVDRKGRLYGSCGPRGEVLLFGDDENFEKEGAYCSRVFDSTIEACQWHRLALDIQPAEKSTLDLLFRTSDQKSDFDSEEEETKLDWQFLFSTPLNSVDVDDALFRGATGRYLQLKFRFTGDGFHTHRVRRAQLYFQRLSYLRYLPATYQEDEEGRDFLERFLSIFESVSLDIERKIAEVSSNFDPEAADSEFLKWLGAWIAVLRDDNWPEEKSREFLSMAFQLYRARGTARGLREMIELFTEGRTSIIEHHRLRAPMVLGASSTLGRSTVVGISYTKRLVLEESSRIGEFALIETDQPVEKPFEAGAFDFTLLADTSGLENEAQRQAIRRMVEEEKPAHTRCFLRTGSRTMQLGVRALLEVDTTLSRGFETARLGINSQIGKQTFLGTKFRRRGVIGVRSTIAVDAVLQ